MTEETPLEEIANEPDTPVIEKPEEKSEEKQQEKEKAKKRLSDRLKEETWKRREAERQFEAEKKAREELEAQTKLKVEPKEDDYADFTKFQEDKDRWAAQKEQEIEARVTQKVQQEQHQKQAEQARQANQAEYLKSREQYAKDDPKFRDYEVEIDRHVNAYGAPELQDLILKAKEIGPRMVKHLGTHPEELLDIASSPQAERAFLLGKLQAKLEAKPVKKVSSAPDPVRSGTDSAQVQANPTNETQAEYNRRVNFGT